MFTYYIQYGGDPYDKYEHRGATDFNHFITVFENFPWKQEIANANANPQGSSPTLSVKNAGEDTDFWVSMSGDDQIHGYLLGYIHTVAKKRWFGFLKPKNITWLEIYMTRDTHDVKHYFNLYFAGKNEQLLMGIRKLQRFTALETRN